MKIRLLHKDAVFYGIDEFVLPVIQLARKKRIYVEILCQILTLYRNVSNSTYGDIEHTLRLYRNLYFFDSSEFEIYEYNKFSDKLLAFYWEIIEEAEYNDDMNRFNPELYAKHDLNDKNRRFGRYRGIMFECLISELVKERFTDKMFDTGCRVYIDGQAIIIQYGEGNADHKETFDIVGWDESNAYGEFYECKISPDGFKEENCKLFIELNNVLSQHKDILYILGFVSADEQKYFESKISSLEKNGIQLANVQLIGKENIFDISEYSIPVTA